MLSVVALVATAACRADRPPNPLRGKHYQLLRVNGVLVRGESEAPPPDGSSPARLHCQDKVAEGVFTVNPDGRAFQYRTTWRDCTGAELVTETNEGFIEAGQGKLTLLIEGGSAGGTFKGEYTDSSLTVYDLGGRLYFVKAPAR